MPGTDSSVSESTGNKASASPARRTTSRTVRENVHTNVLGRDAADSTRDIGFATDVNDNNNNNNNSGNTNDASNVKNSGWWGSSLFGGSNESSEGNKVTNNANRIRRKNNARYDGLQQSTAHEDEDQYDPPALPSTTTADSACSVATDSVATVTVATAATREDQVREECQFFYRGPEDDPSSTFHKTRSHRSSGRTKNAANSMLRRSMVRARLSGQLDGAVFMSRYERLNQVMERSRRRLGARHIRGQHYDGNDNSNSNLSNEERHDLFLDESSTQGNPSSYREHIPSPTDNVVMGATSLANPHGVRSSMFFEQDGKVLMRLPRDQVRLVMDYNIEPGILSVEQWRSKEDVQAANEKLARHNLRERLSTQRERELRYRQREKDRRHRRLRRKERERQRLRHQKTKINKEGEKTDTTKDPLEVESGGQLTMEAIPLEEGKGELKDVEDPCDEDDDSYSSYSNDYDSYFDEDWDESPENLLPELRYVITIPDDIYRRMVGEMSDKAFPPYWGFFKCCTQESEPADIKLALVILAVVMFFLFVGSLEWRKT